MKTVMIACLASLIALPAMARRDPQPTDSGIVIHLFGPDFITNSNTSTPAPSSSSAADKAGATVSAADGASTATSAPALQPEPTMGQVLHELFVTGDPAETREPHFSKGRATSN